MPNHGPRSLWWLVLALLAGLAVAAGLHMNRHGVDVEPDSATYVTAGLRCAHGEGVSGSNLVGPPDPPTPGVVLDPRVTPLIAAVDAVLQPLLAAQKNRGQLEGQVEQTRIQIEPLRKGLCVAFYKNTGAPMEELGDNPEEITAFFDLETLRQTGEEEEDPAPIPPAATPVAPAA